MSLRLYVGKARLPQRGQWSEIRDAVVYILGCADTLIVPKVLGV